MSDYAAAMGSCVFIVYAVGSPKLSKLLLLRKPVVFLGKISYSLYLFHLPVLFGFMYLLYGKMPNATICSGTILVSLMLAALSWRFIETPSIRWGKKLTSGPSLATIKRPLLTEER